ncbi:MAG: hypothetical protein AAGA56_22535 [Myxococcota bacterium]
MKKIVLAAMVLGFGTVGCGKDAKPLVDAAETYAKDMCDCKDTDCTKKASDAYAKATDKLKGEKLTPSEEQTKAIAAATEKATGCATKMASKMAEDAMKKAGDAVKGMPGMDKPAADKEE